MKNLIIFTKQILFTVFITVFCSNAFCQTQTTVTFKPGPASGKDALIYTTGTCVLNGYPLPCADMNFGNEPEIAAVEWTWNLIGCREGTVRSLLKFEELSTIPSNAQIVSAELKLFGVSNSSRFANGNSSYPGAPSSFLSNQSLIQRVTSTWNEQTVTWNTRPSTTTTNQITISSSTSQWNWNFSTNHSNLVAMIQDMVTNPSTNFGFMIRLETETIYRSLLFASSDHSNNLLWPELTVSYTTPPPPPPPCPCEANFTYLVNTIYPSTYYFSAPYSALSHSWTANGVVISNASSFVSSFPGGTSQKICYIRKLADNTCQKCITLCIERIPLEPYENEENTKLDGFQEIQEINEDKFEEEKTDVIQGILPTADFITFDNTLRTLPNSIIEIYPNPTTKDWTVKIVVEKKETVKIQLLDIYGKVVYSDSKILLVGNNNFEVNSNNLIQGNYLLQINGSNIRFTATLLKE